MIWYYVNEGQQAGPVDEAQLEQLVGSGTIQVDTLIWSEGMANWQTYGEVKGLPQPMEAAPPVAVAADALPVAEGQAVCSECRNVFSVQDMIRYGNVQVCANCKPIFMQKLAEGARLSAGAMTYAGFWIRFSAVFLDGIILFIVNMVIAVIARFGVGQPSGIQPTGAIILQLVLLLIQIAIQLAYEVVMIGKYGATLGKMACQLKVVTAEGGKVSYLQSLGRYFAKMLSFLICAIGYIIAAFDEEKRALHDRICNTRVVMK